VQDIAGKFIVQNFRDRSNDSKMTGELLRDNLDAAKKELEGAEAKLAEFRIRNQGRLPEEMQGNVAQMNATQARLSALSDSLNRANQNRVMKEGMLRIYKDQIAVLKQPKPPKAIVSRRRSERLND